MRLLSVCGIAAYLLVSPLRAQELEICTWQDGKEAAFFLAFDDACPTHETVVAPLLERYGIPGTFYINRRRAPEPDGTYRCNPFFREHGVIVPGNHTATHCGATNLVQCEEEIAAWFPAAGIEPKSRLVSFAIPGGVPWKVSEPELSKVLDKYGLVLRPPFWTPGWQKGPHPTNRLAIASIVDETIRKGGAGHFDFHGVAGDWLETPADWFVTMLEVLDRNRDRLWLTTHIAAYQYRRERETANLRLTAPLRTPPPDAKDPRASFSFRLDTPLPETLFNQPLTLKATLPFRAIDAQVSDGKVRISGTHLYIGIQPNRGEVTVTLVPAPNGN